MTDDDVPQIHVRMSQLALAKGPSVLKTTLGSCVGIAFVWREAGRFALAHCLLPEAPSGVLDPGAKYVDQTVITLLRMMKATPSDRAHIEAHLAGGAAMYTPLAGRDAPHIGMRNGEVATNLLREQGIRVVTSDLGGCSARQMRLVCPSGEVTVRRISVPEVVGASPSR